MRRRLGALLAVVVGLLAPTTSAGAEVPKPTSWPAGTAIDTEPHAVRFGGVDRAGTAAALAVALRGNGGYPFSTPDESAPWWGLGTCPTSIVLVGGDTFADALAAASLSDPTDRSDEPTLVRVASADPVFDPVGETGRVDTEAAPILVTTSARQGGTRLDPKARAAAADLAAGGCTTARSAIIVGGTAAVPTAVESELLGLGYDQVFRVAGVDRYDTAARVAASLGTDSVEPGTQCVDPDASDGTARMGWYGNAVFEFRLSATECRVLGNAVVLADGGTGADALAAGWWTSYWQVPVLLTAPDGGLPEATKRALRTLPIESIIVLGGTGRIPESTVEEAKLLAGAVAGRVAGADRYETSVAMAQRFGGWFPIGGTAFAGDVLCVAASSGSGAAAEGWPDALAAGPWCGRATAAGADAPARALPPVSGPDAGSTDFATIPGHDAVPILLVPAGAEQVPESVRSFLDAAFLPSGSWCSGRAADGACAEPGFVAASGGRASLSTASLAELSLLVSGSREAEVRLDTSNPFVTALDLSPIYDRVGGEAGAAICADRDGIRGARWLKTDLATLDLVASRRYLVDADGVIRSPRQSAPLCLAASNPVALTAISSDGHRLDRPPASTVDGALTLSGDVVLSGPITSSGAPSGDETAGAETTLDFRDAPPERISAREDGTSRQVRVATLDLTLKRGVDAVSRTPPHTFAAVVELDLGDRVAEALVVGEAVLRDGVWELAGRSVIGERTGGFRGVLDPRGTEANGDDRVVFRLDVYASS